MFYINSIHIFKYHSIKTHNHIKRKLKEKNGKF
jgi:hypothetical protein